MRALSFGSRTERTTLRASSTVSTCGRADDSAFRSQPRRFFRLLWRHGLERGLGHSLLVFERGRPVAAGASSSWSGAPSSTSTAPPTSGHGRCGPTTCCSRRRFGRRVTRAGEASTSAAPTWPTTAFGPSRRAGARPRSRLSIRALALPPGRVAVTRGATTQRDDPSRAELARPCRRGGAVPLRRLTDADRDLRLRSASSAPPRQSTSITAGRHLGCSA